MRPAIVLLALAPALCLLGCRRPAAGGPTPGSTGTPTPTAVATPVSLLPPGVLTTLRRYSLVQNDMPAGYAAGGLLEVPNEQAVNDYADPRAAKQEVTDTGRQGGLGQQIMGPPTVNGTFGLSIELFKDAAGAQRWASQPPASPPDLQMTQVPQDQSYGDASSTMHWSKGAQSGYVLSFSRGQIVYGLGVQAPSGQESLGPLQTLAQSIELKLKQQSN